MSRIERRNQILAPFKCLWKTEDKAWMSRRRADWKVLASNRFSDCTKVELTAYKKYFLTGEWLKYIPESTMFFLTPFTSPKEAKHFFYSKNFGPSERSQLFASYLIKSSVSGAEIDWLPQQTRYFVDGILGHEYQIIEESEAHIRHRISPTPNFFCRTFIAHAKRVLSAEIPYHAYVEVVDYFVSAWAYVDDADIKNVSVIDSLFDLVNQTLSDTKAGDVAKKLAQELQANEKKIRSYIDDE
jgi:hypothetical protein